MMGTNRTFVNPASRIDEIDVDGTREERQEAREALRRQAEQAAEMSAAVSAHRR